MRKRHSLWYHVVIFVLAQLTWLSILGLWIYWYVSNYIIFQKVGQRISPKLITEGPGSFALVSGLVLLLTITVLISLLFKYLYGQVVLHRLYGNFIANVSHELKSPLSSMQLHLETLSLREMPVEQRRMFHSLLLGDVARLHGLIETILEIAGLEQNRNLYRYSVQAMESLVEVLARQALETFGLPEAALTVEGEAHCACVVDQAALQTVFNNLVDNTVKYSSGEPRIQVRLTSTGRRFLLEFRDFGIGIEAVDQKKIFNKFYRASGRNAPSVKGVGLGLYRVREILRAHGGRVTVTSGGTGRGTTFRLVLPVYGKSKKHFTKKLLRITGRKHMEDGYERE